MTRPTDSMEKECHPGDPRNTAGALRSRRRQFLLRLLAILLVAFSLRVIGIDWGLPDQLAPGDPPFHPDEQAVYSRGRTLYTNPDAVTFGWGGVLYFRVSLLAGALANRLSGIVGMSEFATTLLLLRGLNVVLGTATVGLVGLLSKRAYGSTAGLLAAALLASFPNHVLSSHYARPDILMTFLCTGALASATWFASTGRARAVLLGSTLAGLALSTSSWGLVAFVPQGTAWLVRHATKRRRGDGRRALATLCAIPLGGAAGYLLGSVETFLFWDAFEAAFRRTAGMHDAGGFTLPTDLVTTASFYAFGTTATLFSYAGLALFLVRRRPTDWIMAGFLLAGCVILSRMRSEMMRYVLFMAPVVAIAAAVFVTELSSRYSAARNGKRWPQLIAPLVVVLLTLQLSATYVGSMGFTEDPRVRAGKWIVANAPARSRVGITQSFYGDKTYGPRLPPPHRLKIRNLQLRGNVDSSGYLSKNLEFVATSDFAISRARGKSAPEFLRRLREGRLYRNRAEFGSLLPPLYIADWLGFEPPGDLMYVRPTLYVYQRVPKRTR